MSLNAEKGKDRYKNISIIGGVRKWCELAISAYKAKYQHCIHNVTLKLHCQSCPHTAALSVTLALILYV